jgi:hypothetical protein
VATGFPKKKFTKEQQFFETTTFNNSNLLLPILQGNGIKPQSQILRVTTQSEILIRQCYGHFVPDIYLLLVRTKDHMPLHKSTIISSEHTGLVFKHTVAQNMVWRELATMPGMCPVPA